MLLGCSNVFLSEATTVEPAEVEDTTGTDLVVVEIVAVEVVAAEVRPPSPPEYEYTAALALSSNNEAFRPT